MSLPMPKGHIPAAGLELDKLIAEKVLGWHKYNKANPILASERFEWWDEDGSGPVFVNHYSTDIKAAWDLVEKFKLCVIPWAGQWMAIKHDEIHKDSERNIAPTAPHAICLAALFYASEGNE